MKFDIAISLGMNCQSRYNILRTIYLRENNSLDGFVLGVGVKSPNDYGTFFFDWCITPISSLIFILENEFSNVLEYNNLEIKAGVLDKETGCLYPHFIPGISSNELTEDILYNEYPVISKKYQYLIQKTLLEMKSQNRKLYVLNGNQKNEDIFRLVSVLKKYSTNFMLLYAPYKNKPNYDELQKDFLTESLNFDKLLVRPIDHAPYPGNFSSWDEAFSGIDFIFKH